MSQRKTVLKNARISGELESYDGWKSSQPEFYAAVKEVDPDTVEDWRPFIQEAIDNSRLVEFDPARTWVLKDLGTYQGVVMRPDRLIEVNRAVIKLADNAILPSKSIALFTTFKTGSPDAPEIDGVVIRDAIFDLNGAGQPDQSITLMAINGTGRFWTIEDPLIVGARAGQRECFAVRVVPRNHNDNVNSVVGGVFRDPAPNVEYQSTVTGHVWEISAFSAGTVERCRVYGDKDEAQVSTIHGVVPGCRIRPRIMHNYAEGRGMKKCVWWQWGSGSEAWFVDIESGGNTYRNIA